MNLKEAFRYQKFLSGLLTSATMAIMSEDNCLKTVKTHHCNKANPETEDYIEEVTSSSGVQYDPMVLVAFMQSLIEERGKLTDAINHAKSYTGSYVDPDLDAAIETNKFRQSVYDSMKRMLSKFRAYHDVDCGQAYKFNVDGNQVPYYYDIDVEVSEKFDRDAVRKAMRDIITDSDSVSARIDEAMIEVNVYYEPPYNVNDSFEDVIAEFRAV